jgi:hypothetical protein
MAQDRDSAQVWVATAHRVIGLVNVQSAVSAGAPLKFSVLIEHHDLVAVHGVNHLVGRQRHPRTSRVGEHDYHGVAIDVLELGSGLANLPPYGLQLRGTHKTART